MGWSCAAAASKVIELWSEACIAQTQSQNTFRDHKGTEYFWERSNKEHADGAITGTMFKMVGDTHCQKAGTFRIEGDGKITRAPIFLKKAA